MKERILAGWSLARVLYFMLGSYVIVQSVIEKHWLGVVIGGYFAAMGLFRFGCAAGNCFTPGAVDNANEATKNIDVQQIEYEEVKLK